MQSFQSQASSGEFYQTFKVEIMVILHTPFHMIDTEGILRSSYQDSTTLTKPDKAVTRTLQTYLTKVDINPQKVFVKCTLKYVKIIIHQQMGFIPGIKSWLKIQKSINTIHHNRLCKGKLHDHSYRCRKSDITQHTVMIKTHSKLGIDGHFITLLNNITKTLLTSCFKVKSGAFLLMLANTNLKIF